MDDDEKRWKIGVEKRFKYASMEPPNTKSLYTLLLDTMQVSLWTLLLGTMLVCL